MYNYNNITISKDESQENNEEAHNFESKRMADTLDNIRKELQKDNSKYYKENKPRRIIMRGSIIHGKSSK